MAAKRALILFAHGARDPAWAEPFQRLRKMVAGRRPDVSVHLAFLELMQPSLPAIVDELAADGCTDVAVVPVFLGQGGHVRRDLPVLVEGLRERHAGLRLKVAEAAGENDVVLAAIGAYCLDQLSR